jgi:uncharacterized protein YlxW (UPF0749 family)
MFSLLEFLFGSHFTQKLSLAIHSGNGASFDDADMIAQIQRLQNQVNSLQQRVIELENQTKNLIDASRGQKKAPEEIKSMILLLNSKKGQI